MTIASLIQRISQECPDREALIDSGHVYTYHDLYTRAQQLAAVLASTSPKHLLAWCKDSAAVVFLLVASDLAGIQVGLLSRQLSSWEISGILQRVSCDLLVTDETSGCGIDGVSIALLSELEAVSRRVTLTGSISEVGNDSEVLVFTTGTTGIPKAAVHRWSNLLEGVVVNEKFAGSRWLLTYHLPQFAGIQVLLTVLGNGGTMVIPASRKPEDVRQAVLWYKVECISATPTFWRTLIVASQPEELKRLPIKRITLGGEIATEDVLARLSELFPSAAISHIFATTELGVCFTVRDGKAGFPIDYLNNSEGKVQLRVEDGELFVRSQHAMQGFVNDRMFDPNAWHPTGDLVEVKDDRIYFLGRKSDVINVGGWKVRPLDVEQAILQVPGVRNVRVWGKPNPVAGQIVAAEVELIDPADQTEVRSQILHHCRENLSRYEQPRVLAFVDEVLTRGEKIVRREIE